MKLRFNTKSKKKSSHLSITEIGRYQVMLIICSGLSIMGASLENLSIGYVMPYLKCDLNLSPSEQGVLAAVSYLGIVSTSYFWGFLTDCWGRKKVGSFNIHIFSFWWWNSFIPKVLSVAALFGSFFSFVSAFLIDFRMLILARFLAGTM